MNPQIFIKKQLSTFARWMVARYHQFFLYAEHQLPRLIHYLEQIGKDKHEYQATFTPESKYLSKSHTGVVITGKAISRALSYQHVLINGNSGSGKTTKSAVKNILHLAESKNDTAVSQVILDPSKELYALTSGYVSKTHRIIRLDFSDHKSSSDYNPLHRLNQNDLKGIQKLSTQLVMIKTSKDNSSGSPFWDQSAIELLSFFISLALAQEPEYRHLIQVGTFLERFQDKTLGRTEISTLVKQSKNKWIQEKYASIVGNDERTLDSIISTARTSMTQFMLDQEVKTICSSDSMGDFQAFRKEPVALYIHSSITNANFYSKIISIFITELMDQFFSSLPKSDDLPVFFTLDEFPTLQLDKDLISLLFANARKYFMSYCIYTQDALNQLTNRYGQEVTKTILSTIKTKVFYSISEEMARGLERSFGQYSYMDVVSEQQKSRLLLTIDEMIHFEPFTLVHILGVRPIKTRAVPFYLDPKVLAKTKLPPYVFKTEANQDREVALLNTKALVEQENLIKIPKYGS